MGLAKFFQNCLPLLKSVYVIEDNPYFFAIHPELLV